MGFLYQLPAIVGGTVLVIERIESQNFQPGVFGWAIYANGDAEFNNVVIRGRIIGGDENADHIEINGLDAPNGIAFYTGDAAETFPGIIQPDAVADLIGIEFTSAHTTADTLGSSLKLYAHKLSSTNSQVHLTSLGQVLIDAGHDVTVQNDTTGDFINLNDVAGSNYQGSDLSLYDQLLGGNRGVRVINGYMQPLDLNAWIGTGTTPLTGTWVDTAGARFGYFKDATGRVTVRGKVSGGGAGATVVTLPAGYRPSSNLDFSMRSGTTLCAVGVNTAGVLTVTANLATATVSGINLDVISFPTL